MKLTLPLLFLLISPLITLCQTRYINVINGDVYKIEADYSLSLITTINYDLAIGDIAISPSNILYAVEMGGQILEVNLDNGEVEELAIFPQNDLYTSLVSNDNYELFALSVYNILYKYNITTNTIEVVADIGDASPGDLSFYKGNLIFQSATDGNIKAYNLESGELVTILCRAEPLSSLVGLWGISNSFESCDAEVIYATDNASNLYELDIENGVIQLLEFYDFLSFPQVYDINGMASDNEYLSSSCSYSFDDVACSVTSAESIPVKPFRIYPNPANEYLTIESIETADRVKIYSSTGMILKELNSIDHRISLANIPSGMLYIEIYFKNAVYTQKIVKN